MIDERKFLEYVSQNWYLDLILRQTTKVGVFRLLKTAIEEQPKEGEEECKTEK